MGARRMKLRPRDAANKYASIGWLVIPWAPTIIDGKLRKAPCIEEWQTLASTDADIIARWWREFPQAQVGIHLGLSGLAVIDIDNHPGRPDGRIALRAIEAEHGSMLDLDCLVQRSPQGGGTHYLFRADHVLTTFKLADGIDVLAGNRWLAVAPSALPDGLGVYRWDIGPFDDGALARMPVLPQWAQNARTNERLSDDELIIAADLARVPDTPTERQRVRTALKCIDPDIDRTHWLRVGMALRSTMWADWRDLWEKWSRGKLHDAKAEKFDARQFGRDARSLSVEGGVTIATLYSIAEKFGFDTSRKNDAKPKGQLRFIEGASLPIEPISWIWPDYLPRGKFVALAGPGGLGKTQITCDLIARATTGRAFPDGSRCEPVTCVIYSTEDGTRDTLVPRLIAAGADLTRVKFIGDVDDELESRPFDPTRDVPAATESLAQFSDFGILVFDPVTIVVKGDSHKAAEVRRDLLPLQNLAKERNAVVIGITHFAKSSGDRSAIDRVLGSGAWTHAARLVLLVSEIDRDDGTTTSVMMRGKSNLGVSKGGFEYRIEPATAKGKDENGDDVTVSTSRIVWGNAINGSADDVLAPRRKDQTSKLDSAKEWLVQFLTEHGPTSEKEIKDAAKFANHAPGTIDRAKQIVGIESKKFAKSWKWLLPQEGANDEL